MPLSAKTKALLGAVLLVGLALGARPVLPSMQAAMDWIAASGWTGRLAFVGLYVLACVLFLPGSILTLGAGAAFGLGWGFGLVSLASTLGATASFLLGRTVARSFVQRKVAADPRFTAIDAAVAREGWKIVGLARLSPVFPFNLLNYGLGLTSVGLRDYVLASWIGMMPGTLLYVYLGSLAGGLASGAARQRGLLEWALYGAGLLATVLVSALVTRIAQRALKQSLPAKEQAS
jgi:uncharacterized membrane protein YdjX (TVP38/TMEM64 family)